MSTLTKSCCVCPFRLADGSDRAGGGGGFLPVLAPSPRRAPLGGVWELPAEPGLLRVPGGGPLPGVQQLVGQPSHLRLPVGELQEGLQASLQVPDGQRGLSA